MIFTYSSFPGEGGLKMELPQIFWSILQDLYKICCFSVFAYQPVSVKMEMFQPLKPFLLLQQTILHGTFQFYLWSELYFIG